MSAFLQIKLKALEIKADVQEEFCSRVAKNEGYSASELRELIKSRDDIRVFLDGGIEETIIGDSKFDDETEAYLNTITEIGNN